jgi:hypothetical protein
VDPGGEEEFMSIPWIRRLLEVFLLRPTRKISLSLDPSEPSRLLKLLRDLRWARD